MLLYPYQIPSFASFSLTPSTSSLEVGATVNITNTAWSYTNGININPTSVYIKNPTGLYMNFGLSYPTATATPTGTTGSITSTTSGIKNWTIYGSYTNVTTTSINRSASIAWYWKTFWGNSATTALPLSATITGSTSILNGNAPNGAGTTAGTYTTYTFGAAGSPSYRWVAFPSAYATTWIGSSTASMKNGGISWATSGGTTYSSTTTAGFHYAPITVTNRFGQGHTYYLFMSANKLADTFSVDVYY
jgi:hypothetical protein